MLRYENSKKVNLQHHWNAENKTQDERSVFREDI